MNPSSAANADRRLGARPRSAWTGPSRVPRGPAGPLASGAREPPPSLATRSRASHDAEEGLSFSDCRAPRDSRSDGRGGLHTTCGGEPAGSHATDTTEGVHHFVDTLLVVFLSRREGKTTRENRGSGFRVWA